MRQSASAPTGGPPLLKVRETAGLHACLKLRMLPWQLRTPLRHLDGGLYTKKPHCDG